jgi:hypothetical protein
MQRLLVLLPFLLSCAGYHLPYMSIPDTRTIQAVVASPQVSKDFTSMADSLMQGKPTESGRCVYGHVILAGERGAVLRLEKSIPPAQPDLADSVSIQILCQTYSGKEELVAIAHTHPNMEIGELCRPSTPDFYLLNYYPTALASFIYCSNGLGYRQFKDGRWSMYDLTHGG